MTYRLRLYALCAGVALASLSPLAARAADTLSTDVGATLQQAQSALAAHDYAKAMQAVKAASALGNKSDYDSYVIAQMQAAVASQSGDTAAALSAYEKLIASPRTPPALRHQMLLSEATMAYSAKDYPRAIAGIQRYMHEAGPTPQMQLLLVQSYYLQKDYPNVIQTVKAIVAADNKAHRKPQESELQMMAASATALNDPAQATHAYLLLATYYPKKEYWALLLHGLVTNKTLPPALQLDVYRIRVAVGDTLRPVDFMDMTEIAMQLRLPQLALDLMDQGYKQGVLGVGPEAPRQARLKAMVEKTVAERKASSAADEAQAQAQKTGDELFLVGYNDVTFGETQKGLALMRQALDKGVRDSAIANLHLGLAYMQAGQKAAALSALALVPETSNAYDIARLWMLRLSQTEAAPK